MIRKVNHIGIVVKNLNETVKLYSKMLGKQPDSQEEVAAPKMKIANYQVGETALGFLEVGPGSPLDKFIETWGEGIHHLCFEVDDIKSELQRLSKMGVKIVDKEPQTWQDSQYAFVGPKGTHGVTIELVQPRNKGEENSK